MKTWGRGKVRRLLGKGAGLIFKGSGFYTTDYRSAAYKEHAKKDAPPSESKPAETKKTPAEKSTAQIPNTTRPAHRIQALAEAICRIFMTFLHSIASAFRDSAESIRSKCSLSTNTMGRSVDLTSGE